MPKAPSLRPKRLPSRPAGRQWCVNVPPGLSTTRERQRLFFANKLEAENECERLKTLQVNFGHSLSSLSAARIAEASACFQRLDREAPGITLTAALSDFLESHHARTASIPMSILWERFIASKSTKSNPYKQSLKATAKRLDSLLGMIASDITPEAIEKAIAGFPPSSRNAVLAYLRGAFNFGIRVGVVQKNPVDRMEFTTIVPNETEVLTPETVENLLLDAIDNDLSLIPFLVLAFYAGVRPSGELQKILWSDINLNAKKHHVTIRAAIAKKRRKRWIDLSDNAIAWLLEYRARGGRTDGRITPLSASTLRRKRRRNALTAGLDEWPQQVARHTYCSCWLAQHGDIDELVLQAGHESASIMFARYYQAITPEAAASFWNIFPPLREEQRIVAFSAC
jgi:integrase